MLYADSTNESSVAAKPDVLLVVVVVEVLSFVVDVNKDILL